MSNRDEFDEEGFIDNLLNRQGKNVKAIPKARLLAAVCAAVVVLVLVIIVSVVWSGDSKVDEAEVPVILAEGGAYKVEPEDRGGMDVPNKDSTVFENLKGTEGDSARQVENILEDAEQPVKKGEVFVEGETPVTSTADSESEIIPAPEAKGENAPVVEEMTDKKAEPVKSEPVKKATAKPTPLAKGDAYVQLGAVKTEADAKAQWPKLQKLYPSLAALSLRIQKAETPKGVFYRIQAGPLGASAAREACAAINAKKSGGCLVAKP
jgi:cell division septation protein DedD